MTMLKLATTCCALLVLSAAPSGAAPGNGEKQRSCSVTIGGSTFYIDTCTVRTSPTKLEVSWPHSGARSYRVVLSLENADEADASWNGTAAREAVDSPLGRLNRDEACWRGDEPKVSICTFPNTASTSDNAWEEEDTDIGGVLSERTMRTDGPQYDIADDEVVAEAERLRSADDMYGAFHLLDEELASIERWDNPERYNYLEHLRSTIDIELETQGDRADNLPTDGGIDRTARPQPAPDNQIGQLGQSSWANRLSATPSGPTLICWASTMDMASSSGKMMLRSGRDGGLESQLPQQWIFARGGSTGLTVNGNPAPVLHKDDDLVVVRVGDMITAPRVESNAIVQERDVDDLQRVMNFMMGQAAPVLGYDKRAFVINFSTGGAELVTFDDTQQHLFDRVALPCQ